MWRLNVGSIVAGTGRWQLECLDGEWEVLVIRIVDKESVVDGLLETLSLVTGGNKGTSFASCGALLDTSGLGKSFIMCLNSVNNDSPFSISIDSTKWLNVSGY